MSNYNSLTTSSNTLNNDQYECLKEYYRYLVGMSMNQQQQQQQSSISNTLLHNIQLVNTFIHHHQQQQHTLHTTLHTTTTTTSTVNPSNYVNKTIINDVNRYQKIYVDTLVDITSLTIRTSWPSEMSATNTKDGQLVVNTNTFVRHLLKRSRATRSTLQLAIFYLFRIRPHIGQRSQYDSIVKCGRRMFLAALICAHKYLYDNTFTNASWAKISKLSPREINHAERALLEMLDYKLFVPVELYQKFESQLKEAMPKQVVSPSSSPSSVQNSPLPRTSSPVPSRKRSYTSVEQAMYTPHSNANINNNSKKPKQTHPPHYHIHHGIPTPEDDKVDFY
ncbi:hypothetical protein BDF20DRAFT_842175 [Mycotypha africana]|uniref:uncharacterized protein n=1 Tax=Mycotypha africana TaxID=64632 RepID=UPI002300D51F|nr:uncharacterized protein BDF20DRAFT_842175 [Mycotypha africana]KAI8991006.1 hypothetical protein BDF20DRAFT_842175 [Mycotypha africana]